jgi:hypothetical protein
MQERKSIVVSERRVCKGFQLIKKKKIKIFRENGDVFQEIMSDPKNSWHLSKCLTFV